MGAARSGVAAARFLNEKGVDVFISDNCPAEKLGLVLASNGLAHLHYEGGGHTQEVLSRNLIIRSPGVPHDAPILAKAREKGVPIWSELELGFRHSEAGFLAVTGSTGKSTTVSLLGAILGEAGIENVVAGNVGLPVVGVAPELPRDGYAVVEMSSFQLEDVDLLRPRAAAVLNFMKNHLDRYESEDDYYNAKKTVARNMGSGDTLVLNGNDDRLVAWAKDGVRPQVKVVFFGTPEHAGDAVWHEGTIMYRRQGDSVEELGDLGDMRMRGTHNLDNAAAAAALALAVGVEHNAIVRGICSFAGLPHRLEFVKEISGISFYNDSKATTAESVACAVKSFNGNVRLIAGGRDKRCDFLAIRNDVRKNVKSAFLIGEAAERIKREWQGAVSIESSGSLAEAVVAARKSAEEGDVVLLSPGCSSFDMFADFEERGEEFKRLVGELG